jgi:hypothetical protein
MRPSQVIDEASTGLAAVESAVGTARHVLDVAAEVERQGSRMAGRLRTAAVVVVIGVTVVGGAVAVKAFFDHRRTPTPNMAGTPIDDAISDAVG